jgi:D-glycero-D-manno-heptose 1,7-bisphosphate phosphatase
MKAVFLDRDGVINHDPGDYTTSLTEFVILPTVIETLVEWSNKGYAIIVITNQGGIAKGLYTFEDFYEIDAYMRSKFIDAGVNYLETYFCPHHDAVSHCLCRKPHSGMIEKAIARFGVDAEQSVMIGDKWRDLEAAEGAGVKGIKIDTNQPLKGLDLSKYSN